MINVDILGNGQIIAYGTTITDSARTEKIHFNFPESWNGYVKKEITVLTERTVTLRKRGVDYFTDPDIAGLNIPKVDQKYNATSENSQSGKAVSEAVSPIRQTITVDAPVWTVQPTVDGALNEAFETWDIRPYFGKSPRRFQKHII